jgi:Domain of unknown function (DUF4288)
MKHFVAHLIVSVEFKNTSSSSIPVWENMIFIRAKDESSALKKAEKIGSEYSTDFGGSYRYGGKKAELKFLGVRKLIECSLFGEEIGTGDEISYSKFKVGTKNDLKKLLSGKSCKIEYEE